MPIMTNQTDSTLIITHKGGKSVKFPPRASIRILAMTDEIRSAEKRGLIAGESSLRKKAVPQETKPEPKPEPTLPEVETEIVRDESIVDRQIAEMIEAGQSRRSICDALNVPLSRIRKAMNQGE
jgi:hypothetical protein